MVTNSIPHVYILISPEYTDAIGKKNVKNENSIYEEFKEKYGDKIELIKQEIFNTEYHGYNYSICLIEKDN